VHAKEVSFRLADSEAQCRRACGKKPPPFESRMCMHFAIGTASSRTKFRSDDGPTLLKSAGAVPIAWLDSFIKSSIEGTAGRGDIMPSSVL
jgi:hypothetical protein